MTHTPHDGCFEQNEAETCIPMRELACSKETLIPTERQQLDELLEMGFRWEEAVRLLYLHTHLYDNAEMRQRLMADYRIHFARWLYERGTVNEE